MPRLKNTAIIIFLLLLSSFLKAQYPVPGYLIKKTKDTVWGTVYVKKKKMNVNMDALYKSVTFTDSSTHDESGKNYNANDILGFGLRGEDISEDFISPKGLGEQPKNFFYRRIETGYVELFESIEKVSQSVPNFKPDGTFGSSTLSSMEHAFLIKIGGLDSQPLKEKNDVYKKKYLLELFKNHPEILKKIETDLDFSALLDLIREYNKKYV